MSRALAYYLPQFHRTPENDLWHGEGFTEWTKVKAAKPQWAGHRQPREPHPDLGYYTLETKEVFLTQAKMMSRAGVEGAVLYFYWFNGKRLLDSPEKLLKSNPDIPMNFCFSWANENWTRTWDGGNRQVLMEQTYGEAGETDLFEYLIEFFLDPRYIKVGNRPVFFIYRPTSIPNLPFFTEYWKTRAASHGIGAPYFVAEETFLNGSSSLADGGFDAFAQRPGYIWEGLFDSLAPLEPGKPIFSYEEASEHYIEEMYQPRRLPLIPAVLAGWDASPRHGDRALILHNRNLSSFRNWCDQAIDFSRKSADRQSDFVLINSWNEWAEGSNLEPDSAEGYGYIDTLRSVIDAHANLSPKGAPSGSITLVKR